MHADLVIYAPWIAPVEPNEVYAHHALVIRHGKVLALLPENEAREQVEASRQLELDDHLLIPGLINSHTHAAMSLLRGYADDLPLSDWLQNHIWPMETRLVSPDFVRDGSLLAANEMLSSGTTCFADMYFFPDAMLTSAQRIGLRVVAGIVVVDFPTSYGTGPEDYLTKGLQLYDLFQQDPKINFMFAPHAPYTVGDESIRRIRTLANELELPIQIHLHETSNEVSNSIRDRGQRPIERLNRMGLLSQDLSTVHMTQITEADIELLKKSRVSVIHCPESNLKLASGFCPVARLQEEGINVGLGTDGAASNNNLDMIGEMRTGALLSKGVHGDPTVSKAKTMLEIATLGGAKALGLSSEIGSLKPGKWADLVAVNLGAPELVPVFDPISTLIYASDRQHVTQVWIAGEAMLTQGHSKAVAPDNLRGMAQRWKARVMEARRKPHD